MDNVMDASGNYNMQRRVAPTHTVYHISDEYLIH